MITSRTRVVTALNHQEMDRVPLDLGSTPVTGMHVSSVYKLRQILNLDEPGTPIKVIDPMQMLGEIAPDLIERLGVDTIALRKVTNHFGFRNEGWKPWKTFDGTPVLVPELFNTVPSPNGDLFQYPQGDPSAPPSGRMPAGGWYHDAIIRQPPFEETNIRLEDNLEEFGPISTGDLEYYQEEALRLNNHTDKAIVANFGGTAFGDIALVPAVGLKYPKGIRELDEWYMSLVSRPDHLYRLFEKQCEIGLKNLENIYRVVGNNVQVVFITGTDFGAQQGPFISPRTYRKLFKPFHTIVNQWVHEHTGWKSFIHSCGSVYALIPDFIEAGFDILNPVQTSAADMDPERLKDRFGKQLTFWGGGIDTQHTLPDGSPADIRTQVKERLRIFGRNGGFIFNSVHNIQPRVPAENLKALYESFWEYANYSQVPRE